MSDTIPRILVADDDEMIRTLHAEFIRGFGYEVETAADGLAAIQLARGLENSRFDLMVSDVVMPGLGGHEVASRLAREGVIQRALLISGYPDGLPTGGPEGIAEWAFLPKPFTSSELLDAVRRLIRSAEVDDPQG